MFKHTFDFGTTPIEIMSEKMIPEKILSEIFRLIQFVRYDFSQNIHNSSAYRFNSAKTGSPFLITSEFIYFIKVNIFESQKTDFKFLPFYETSEKRMSEFIEDNIIIDGHTVIKKIPLLIETRYLIQPFIIDTIFDLLKDNKFKGFMINTHNYFRCDGKSDREINLEVDSDLDYQTTISNTAIGLNINEEKKFQDSALGFGDKETIFNTKLCILKAPTCVRTRSKSFEVFNLKTEGNLNQFSKENNTDLILYNEKLEQKIIST